MPQHRGGAEPVKGWEPTMTCSLGAFAGLCLLQANSRATNPRSHKAMVVSFYFIAKTGFACCTAWETWQSGVGSALPAHWRELLGFHTTATAAAWILCHALHAKADPSTCAASSIHQSIPRVACTSPGNIFNWRTKSQLSVSGTHWPHLNIFFPGGVGHARNVSEPGL